MRTEQELYHKQSLRRNPPRRVSWLEGHYVDCNGSREELINILDNLEKYYGAEGELYKQVADTVDAMNARVEGVENGTLKPDAGPADPLRLVDAEGYFHGADTYITSIVSDSDADTITVYTDNALLVRWIADGQVIAVTRADGGSSTLCLDDYSDVLGTYVRAEAFGEGGTVYTQPFVLHYDGQPAQQRYPYIAFPVIDALFASIRTLTATIGRALRNLFR